MIGFVLPFKPRKESSNWSNDNRLLQNTVNSLLQQKSSGFMVYVVYSDEPENKILHENVRYFSFPFRFLEYDEIDVGNPEFFVPNQQRMVERRFDKGRKIIFGCQKAKEDGCSYLMSVDADDLISNKLVEYIDNNSQQDTVAGWYIPKGYVLNSINEKLYRQHKMHLFNGSTHILRADLVPIPDFDSLDWQKYNWFVSHGWTKIRLKEQLGVELLPIPFYGVIYVVHHSNISPIFSIIKAQSFRNFIKKFIYRLPFRSSIKDTFGYTK
jgi:hypothetical protein